MLCIVLVLPLRLPVSAPADTDHVQNKQCHEHWRHLVVKHLLGDSEASADSPSPPQSFLTCVPSPLPPPSPSSSSISRSPSPSVSLSISPSLSRLRNNKSESLPHSDKARKKQDRKISKLSVTKQYFFNKYDPYKPVLQFPQELQEQREANLFLLVFVCGINQRHLSLRSNDGYWSMYGARPSFVLGFRIEKQNRNSVHSCCVLVLTIK